MAHVLKAEYTDQQSLQGFRYFSLDIFQALIPLCHCCEAGATNWLGFSLPTYLSFMMLPPQSCRAEAAHRSEYFIGFTNYAAICRQAISPLTCSQSVTKTSCFNNQSGRRNTKEKSSNRWDSSTHVGNEKRSVSTHGKNALGNSKRTSVGPDPSRS